MKYTTVRGLGRIEFTDEHGGVETPCSVQESSSAEQDAIWLGIDAPKIMVFRANNTGWHEYAVPVSPDPGSYVLINGRMHLDRKKVKDLVRLLNRWLKTGSLADPLIATETP